MLSRLRNFFFGNNETLAQSLVDGAFKAAFSGLVVAAAGMYVLGGIEASFERAEKRAALRLLRNDALTETLSAVNRHYLDLDCARDAFQLLDTKCKNKLDSFIYELRTRRGLLQALLPQADLASINEMAAVSSRMFNLQTKADRDKDGADLTSDFSANYLDMVKAIANNFR